MAKQEDKNIRVALDGNGGDQLNPYLVVNAAQFALAMYPNLNLIIFGTSQLETLLKQNSLDSSRYTFHLAPQSIPQDESVAKVLRNYPHSSMKKALEAVASGEADAMISSGGSGPLVCLSRHILGVQRLNATHATFRRNLVSSIHGLDQSLVKKLSDRVRPCFVAKIPVAPQRFALMLDLGANASCSALDLYDFACLGSILADFYIERPSARVSVLNIGTELGKGPRLVQDALKYIQADRHLCANGYIEPNRIFRDDADVIVCDGFSGNIALKAAEGVAELFGTGNMIKGLMAKIARPEWLLPWQYNGSILLGVNGVVIKSHASAGKEALAVAMVEAAKAASAQVATRVAEGLASYKTNK